MFKLTTKEINVTDNAKTYLKKVIGANVGLRLSILAGKGCSGNEYDLSPVSEDKVEASDDRLEIDNGLTIFIPPKDVMKFFGCTIDYIEDKVGNRRLNIVNPNEKGKCGCGSSVSF